MNEVLIPQIIKKELSNNRDSNSREQTLNINLNNNVDRRINNTYTNTYNTSNTTYNESGGFFKFIFTIIILPFTIFYKLYEILEKKFDIKQTLKEERIKLAKSKWVKKYIMSTNDSYNFDEIF